MHPGFKGQEDTLHAKRKGDLYTEVEGRKERVRWVPPAQVLENCRWLGQEVRD